MEKEFVTYDQALALKELGFDEPCFGWYEHNGNFYYCYQEGLVPPSPSKKLIKGCCLAPLKQQAILFLLNKCDNLHGGELSIEYFSDESGILNNYGLPFKSILEAIDKLIGLANDKIV